jgi:hypothetical protein
MSLNAFEVLTIRRLLLCLALAATSTMSACDTSSLTAASDAHGDAQADADTTADAAADAALACLGVASTAGGACTCTADCPMGAACGTEIETQFPGGYCVQGCVTTDAAPPFYVCQQLTSGGGGLFPTCSATHRCRDAYVCIIDPTTNVGTCEPHCSRDSQCTTSGHCDLYSGLCAPEAAGLGLTQTCTRDEQCKSDVCFTGGGPTPNFCATKCDITDPMCPEQGVCVSISSDPGYTAGLCFLPCVNGTCATGYMCSARGTCLPIL